MVVGMGIMMATGILVSLILATPSTYKVEAVTTIEEPKEVAVEVITVIDWTPERIEREIRTVFHEEPNTAVAVAKAEGGLLKERQSDFYRNGIREQSFCAFQIHAPSWEKKAQQLGYGEYRTNPAHCVAMAKYIYDHTGKNFNQWSAWKEGKYLKFL